MYVYITNTEQDCDLLYDRPMLSSGKAPYEKQNRNCLDYRKNLVMSPRGAD
jgi:hypothetical protein